MHFKVSLVRKIFESLFTGLVDIIIFVLLLPQFRGFGPYLFSVLFTIILFWKLFYKDGYSIDNEMVKMDRDNSVIPIVNISYIECSSHFRIIGYLYGDAATEFYYLVTRDSKKYKVDLRHKNEYGETLVHVLECKYKIDVNYL